MILLEVKTFLLSKIIGGSGWVGLWVCNPEERDRYPYPPHSELIEKRIIDFKSEKMTRGYVNRLAKKWGVSYSAVIKFRKKHIEK